nr:MAG TPA: hypothetical protein [Caudoviricetes sp.]
MVFKQSKEAEIDRPRSVERIFYIYQRSTY